MLGCLFFNPFMQQAADSIKKKGFQKRASQQTIGPSYFVRAWAAASWKRKSISFPSLVNLRSKSNFAPIIWLSLSHKNTAGALVVCNLILHMIVQGVFEAKPYLQHALFMSKISNDMVMRSKNLLSYLINIFTGTWILE